MAEHHELVAEMSVLEQMGTQERQKLAKKRRLQQLKKWGQREKEWIAKEKQLNKRLASTLNEENNGLNLKQYTTYSSNHRSKKKLQLSATGVVISSSTTTTANGKNTTTNTASNKNNDFLNNNITEPDISGRFKPSNGLKSALTPNGRVHFDVGVMLLEAAARNDFDEVKRLLMLGVSPDSINHDGLTALHQCCIDASEPMMNLLLEFGANVDARDTEQWTPLHAACTCGHLNLVKILVENGANLLAVNGDGNMPFDICEDEATLDYIESQMVQRGITQEMIDLTRASTEMQMISDLEKQVSNGQDLNVANDNGVTQLHIAAANGYLSVVKFLLKHGVNVNVCDNDLWRPLHGAACWGTDQHAKVIELLVEAGASLDAKTINDETVFDLCDNVDLLEKLNQLKDELESKQASGTDRLRRTQSRTNSRVHSVRRTSVRDKNQISRREAREEALLRVENSPQATNGSQSQTKSNDNHENGTVDDKTEIDTNQLTVPDPTSKGGLVANGSDQVDGLIIKTHSGSQARAYEQTDLGNEKTNHCDETSNHKSSKELTLASNGRSHHSSTNTSSDSISASKRNQTHVEGIGSSKSESTINGDSSRVIQHSSSLSHVQMTTKSQMNGKTLVTIAKSDSQNIEVANGTNNHHGEATASVTINCDPSLLQKEPHSTQSLIQLAPVNYTLSNLKKQRSDLRMRTTSIGGGATSVSTGNTTTNINQVTSSSVSSQVVLDPQPASLPIGNGLHRPESPNLTFRKFRGDPSEVIGGGRRNSRHKCCILI